MKLAPILASALACAVLPQTAAAVDLASHRAIYSMNLASARAGSGIAGVSGAMAYSFSDACDGWTVENRIVLNFAYNEGPQIATTWDFVTWESKDGLNYRFRVRSTRDGQIVEEIDGNASLDGPGGPGMATMALPAPTTLKLPRGTMFPTHHTLRLIEHAERGDRVFSRIIFDGAGDDGPFEVNVVIGQPLPAGGDSASPESPLVQTPSWRTQMAFFPLDSQESQPDYEVGLRYHANGVAQEVRQDFGDFSLKGTLDAIEPLPKPEC